MITRAQIRRQLRKEGGIMNVVPRQGYFLGSIGRAIGKAVGKVGDVAKQVVKSPVGKAALIGLGGAGLMGMGPFAGLSGLGARIGGSGIGQFFKGMGPKLFGTAAGASAGPMSYLQKGVTPFTKGILGKLGLTKGGGSMIPTALGGMTAAGLLTYFMAKGKTEEEAEDLAQDVYRGKGLGMDQIRADMKKYRSGILSGSQAHDMGYHFLTPQTYLGAQGGRVGLKDGTEKIPSSKKQRQEDYSLGMYEAGDIQKETPDRDIIKDFPGATQDMLASYLSKRKRGIPMDQVQTDLIQTYGLSNYSRFMKILKEEGLGDYKYKLGGTDLGPREMIEETTQYPEMAIGGRVGYAEGKKVIPIMPKGVFYKGKAKDYPGIKELIRRQYKKKGVRKKADGGRIGKYGGGITATMPRIPTGMPRVNAGGVSELDYRQEGGYVPMGVKEKADDVPAMLSKNEFVMTADAVKGAGGGNVEKGAQRMYDTMKRLEGRVA